MAAVSISACASTSATSRTDVMRKFSAVRLQSVLGLPSIAMNMRRIRCSNNSMERKSKESVGNMGVGSSVMAVVTSAVIAAAVWSPAAVALVDERLSTEGTGLPFGLSNNLLGWILVGVFGLIWALYFSYVGSLDEDDDSGLSL